MIPAVRSSTRAKRLLLTLLLYKAIASEDYREKNVQGSI